MRRLLFLFLFFSAEATAMYPLLSSSRNIRTHLDVSNNFGRTHFISGKRHYSSQAKNSVPAQTASFAESFCTLTDNLFAETSKIISQARTRIDLAAFSLTDLRIAQQLIDAHKRGVDVCVIVDASNINKKNPHSKAQMLIDNGVTVLYYDPKLRQKNKKGSYEDLMHLKWIITDDIFCNGSANFTRSAQDGKNIESIMVFRCPHQVTKHRKDFQVLKQYCVVCNQTSPAISKSTGKK